MNSYYNNGYYTPQPINKPNIGFATVNGIEDALLKENMMVG